MKQMKLLSSFLLITLGLAASAFATSLTLVAPAPPTQQYQQTLNSPCVFGDPSCKQPAGWGDPTSIAGGGSLQNWGTTALGGPVVSPTYTFAQVNTAIGSGSFIVGIDVNQAQHLSPNLTYFAEFINGIEVATFGTAGSDATATPGNLTLTNNGNGYADALLTGFVPLTAGQTVFFELTYTGANDGTEQFFLVNTSTPPPVIPEPGTLALFGTGLLSVAGFLRRKIHA